MSPHCTSDNYEECEMGLCQVDGQVTCESLHGTLLQQQVHRQAALQHCTNYIATIQLKCFNTKPLKPFGVYGVNTRLILL